MQFETEFDLGQTVYRVGRSQKKAFDLCGACGGKGQFEVERSDGTTQKTYCAACRGHGHVAEVWYDLYEIFDVSRVGRIQIVAQLEGYGLHGDPKYEENYMVEATGVGSGSVYPKRDGVWTHTRLFATEEAALAFCATANVPLLNEVEEQRARVREQVPA